MSDEEPNVDIDPDDLEILQATAEALEHEVASVRKLHEGISGDGVIRSYEVTLRQADGHQVTQIIYLETAPRREDRDGVLVFRDEGTGDEVSVWLYPNDPELPALAAAVYPDAAAVVLKKMAIDPAGLALSLVAYRPGKRAVVRMDTERARIFLKVVRPAQAAALHEQYRVWRDAGLAVPDTLGWSQEGLVGFAALSGVPATDVIADLGDEFLANVARLVTDYGRIDSQTEARASLAVRRDWYVRRVSERYPDLAERATALAERIGRFLSGTDIPAPVTVHSDLHLGQIFVDPASPERVTGILDIDTAGIGDPADDAGAFIAHLLVSAEFERVERGAHAHDFERLAAAERTRVRVGRTVASPDPAFAARVSAITAAHLLAHALGGLVPAERLLERAESLLSEDESLLIPPSFSSHIPRSD